MTTRNATPRATAALPSILEMARMRLAADRAADAFEDAQQAAQSTDGRADAVLGSDLAGDIKYALKGLLTAMPARTLGDAAVQLIAACLDVHDVLEGEDVPPRLRADARAIERVLASVTPVVVDAADLTMHELTEDADGIAKFHARHFPARDGVPAHDHPDAALMALCDEAISVERECARHMAANSATVETEEAAEATMGSNRARLDELTAAIVRTAPVTRAGERAVARLLVELRGERQPTGYHFDDMATALISRLAGGTAGAAAA